MRENPMASGGGDRAATTLSGTATAVVDPAASGSPQQQKEAITVV
jgi:hypothetical protein